MKAYILKNKDDEFASANCAIAYDGFHKMGWKTCFFKRSDDPRLPDLERSDVVVGID
ncbi:MULTISPECIES: hypothetical protein [unclassified Chamaesiphon]|uniref:hypothetical protein n=1 Tax=unclassified Chamaesiphon TaxID=2620921 RepID=UPI00286D35B4|nr:MULTISPECIES: hypothetical protein [unclassified Chamaesiphon]